MHCRMCSQRLPRPGRLCRECEQELDFARSARPPGGLAPGPQLDEVLLAEANHWTQRLSGRPIAILAAFSVGIAAAATLYVVRASWTAPRHESVMLDRDLGSLKVRSQNATEWPRGGAPATQSDVTPRKAHRESVSRAPVATPIVSAAATATVATAVNDPPKDHVATAAPHAATYDRVLGLANAIDGCASESYFARLACEQRARTRYCEGAEGRIPQCAEPSSREVGQ